MSEFEDAGIKERVRTRRQPKLATLASYDGIQILGVPEEEAGKQREKEDEGEIEEEDQKEIEEAIKEAKKGRMKSGKFWKKDLNTK